jgi:hypothetical protein
MRRPIPAKPRGRHVASTVDRLDPEIKKLIRDLWVDHGWRIDDIRAKLIELGKPVSRSALGRHVRTLPEVAKEMREAREMAESLAREVGTAGEDKLAELNIELMHGVLLRLLSNGKTSEDGESVTFGPEEVMFLGRAMKDLAAARKTDVDRVRAREKLIEERAKQAAVAKVEEVAKTQRGLTADLVMQIRHAVLGDA